MSSDQILPAVLSAKVDQTVSSNQVLPAVSSDKVAQTVSSDIIFPTASSDQVLPTVSATQIIPTILSDKSVTVALTVPGAHSLSSPAVLALSAPGISTEMDVNPYIGWSSSSHIHSGASIPAENVKWRCHISIWHCRMSKWHCKATFWRQPGNLDARLSACMGARSISSGPTPPVPTPTSILSTPSSHFTTPSSPLTTASSSVITLDSRCSRQTSPASSSREEGRYKTP